MGNPRDTSGNKGVNQKVYYAHTDPEKPELTQEEGANWQPLKDHLVSTAKEAVVLYS